MPESTENLKEEQGVHHEHNVHQHEEHNENKLKETSKVEAYNSRVPAKALKETEQVQAFKNVVIPPWGYVLIGALGFGVLMLLYNYAANGWNLNGGSLGRQFGMREVQPVFGQRTVDQSAYGPGMMGRNLLGRRYVNFDDEFGWAGFDQQFGQMQAQMDKMERVHDQMMQQFQNVTPDSGFSVRSKLVSNNGSGTGSGLMTFYQNGKSYQLPYEVLNNKLTVKTADLAQYLKDNQNVKVSLNLVDALGKTVLSFSRPEDFASGTASFDLKQGQQYRLNFLVTDEKGNSVISLMEGI